MNVIVGKVIAAGLTVALLFSGCSSRLPGYPAPAISSGAVSSPLAADATRGGEMDALTAQG